MTAITDFHSASAPPAQGKPRLDAPMNIRTLLIFLAVLAGGLFFMAYSIYSDVEATGGGAKTIAPYLLLGVALIIALAFEFVNGFHDTANAVATVIYTHTLKPTYAVIWSGCWNLIGVLTSTGAVAFGVLALLPVELVLNSGSGAGFAMVFALLISAIAMPVLFLVRENVTFFYLLLFVVYYCYGTQFSVYVSTSADFYGTKSLGINYGLLFTAWGVAGLFGPFLGGRVYVATGEYRWAFFVAAAVSLAAIGLLFLAETPQGAKPR